MTEPKGVLTLMGQGAGELVKIGKKTNDVGEGEFKI